MNRVEYKTALKRIEELFFLVDPSTEECREFDQLMDLADEYEKKHAPIESKPLVSEEVPIPTPQKGEVLIKVLALLKAGKINGSAVLIP